MPTIVRIAGHGADRRVHCTASPSCSAAVIRDWPPALVPVDMAWGAVITVAAAAVGRAIIPRRRS